MAANMADLLQLMVDRGASDLHITSGTYPQIRVSGRLNQLTQFEVLTPQDTQRLSYSVLNEGQKQKFEEENELDLSFGIQGLARFRCNVYRQRGAVGCAIRVIPYKIRSFDELSLPQIVQQLADRPKGLILVTGPTGSGKTTTLYSTLKQLAQPDVNVCTIEDPIEMVEPQFNQMQVHSAIGLDFASGVRTLMRQDPDIVMVGEIRDHETADMAIQAALTGHLVLSTLHTNDAPSAITRLCDIGVEPYLLHSTILGVLAQRLVRILCTHCREQTTIDETTWRSLSYPWRLPLPPAVFSARGCLECRMTGYAGRMGLYEMMLMTPALRKLINAETDLAAVREQALRDGMKPLRASGALKVAAGLTSVEEVLKVAPAIAQIERRSTPR